MEDGFEKRVKEAVSSAFGNRADGGYIMPPKRVLILNDPKPLGLDWIEIIEVDTHRLLIIRVRDILNVYFMATYSKIRNYVELANGETFEISDDEYERIANLLVHQQVRVKKEEANE